MKIQSRENVKGNIKTVVSVGNKIFVRLQKNFVGPLGIAVIEWRNQKTNSLVKAMKHKELEEKFEVIDTTRQLQTPIKYDYANLPPSGGTCYHSFDVNKYVSHEKTDREKMIDNKIIEYCESGTMLMAVKYYKEVALVGLKDAKEYVDKLWGEVKKRKDVEVTFIKPDKDEKLMKAMNNFFPNNAARKSFILEAKKINKDSGVLATVKHIKFKTGWGLYESKMFFDNVINAK